MALRRILLEKCLHKKFQNQFAVSSFSTLPSQKEITEPPKLPSFDYLPQPYKGPLADEVLQKRKKFLGPSLFHYYKKPVSKMRFLRLTS